MIHVKIENDRPINMNKHVCNCNGKCITCNCEEKTKQVITEIIPSKLNQILDVITETNRNI